MCGAVDLDQPGHDVAHPLETLSVAGLELTELVDQVVGRLHLHRPSGVGLANGSPG